MEKFLVVGLGNPEGKYFQTWHNLGFQAVEQLAATWGTADAPITFVKKGNQLRAVTTWNGKRVFLLKPLTYMNLSGQAVVALARKEGIPPENVLVFVDDIYLDVGTVRLKKSGSDGGHNGLKSVGALLQSNHYVKIKIGAKPQTTIKGNTADYVLSKIPVELQPTIQASLLTAVQIAQDVLLGVK